MGREKMVCQAWIIKTDAYIITAKKLKNLKNIVNIIHNNSSFISQKEKERLKCHYIMIFRI